MSEPVARKKKKRPKADGAVDGPPVGALEKVPERISRPFAEALKDLRVQAPTPGRATPVAAVVRRDGAAVKRPAGGADPVAKEAGAAGHSYEERVALSQAYRGVGPIGRGGGRRTGRVAKKVVAPKDTGDALARARLAALVADGLNFRVTRDEDGRVRGVRVGAARDDVERLRDGRAHPEAELDLHGMLADAAEVAVVGFLRAAKKGRKRVVRIIHGRGQHSEGGVGVLGDRVVATLSQRGGAPFVLAFLTADRSQGGAGALLVVVTE